MDYVKNADFEIQQVINGIDKNKTVLLPEIINTSEEIVIPNGKIAICKSPELLIKGKLTFEPEPKHEPAILFAKNIIVEESAEIKATGLNGHGSKIEYMWLNACVHSATQSSGGEGGCGRNTTKQNTYNGGKSMFGNGGGGAACEDCGYDASKDFGGNSRTHKKPFKGAKIHGNNGLPLNGVSMFHDKTMNYAGSGGSRGSHGMLLVIVCEFLTGTGQILVNGGHGGRGGEGCSDRIDSVGNYKITGAGGGGAGGNGGVVMIYSTKKPKVTCLPDNACSRNSSINSVTVDMRKGKFGQAGDTMLERNTTPASKGIMPSNFHDHVHRAKAGQEGIDGKIILKELSIFRFPLI